MPRPARKSLLEIFRSRFRKKPVPPPAVAPRPFQAISIFRGATACVPAKRFADYRFLAKDAPQLPLPGCTMASTCQCRYLKHKDRRVEGRRFIDFSASSRTFMGQERRKRRGRRESD